MFNGDADPKVHYLSILWLPVSAAWIWSVSVFHPGTQTVSNSILPRFFLSLIAIHFSTVKTTFP